MRLRFSQAVRNDVVNGCIKCQSDVRARNFIIAGGVDP